MMHKSSLTQTGAEGGYDAQEEFDRYEQRAEEETSAAAARMAAMDSSASSSSSYSAAPSSFSASATRASAAVLRHAAAAAASSSSSSYNSPSSAAAASSSSRYATSGVSLGSSLRFQYSWRLGLVLLPGLLVALLIGGRSLGAVVAVGGLVLYGLDSLSAPEEASFVAVWITTLAAMVSLALSNTLRGEVLGGALFEVLLLTHVNVVVFLAALLASLRFDFLAGELMEVWHVERVLFGWAMLPLTVLEFLAALSALGPQGAPWVLAAILVANYWALATPLPSSAQLCNLGMDEESVQRNKAAFAKAARIAAAQRRAAPASSSASSSAPPPAFAAPLLKIPISELDLVVSAPVAALYAFLVVWLPYLTYLSLHTPGGSILGALANILDPHAVMILNATILMLAAAMKEDLFWFLGLPVSASVLLFRVLVGVSGCVFMVCLECLVIVPVFGGRVLVLWPHWPAVGYVVLSVGIGAAAGAFAILLAGLDGAAKHGNIRPEGSPAPSPLISGVVARDSARVTFFKSLLYLCGFCVGVSLGVPAYGYLFLFVGAWAGGLVIVGQHPGALGVVAALWSMGCYGMMGRTGLAELEFGVRQNEDAQHTSQDIHGSQAHMLWVLACLAIIVPTAHVAVDHACLALRAGPGAAGGGGGGGLSFLGEAVGLPRVLVLNGSAISRMLRGLVGALSCLYVFVLASLEWDWVRMDGRALYDSKVYGWYLVVLTSVLGAALAWRISPGQTGRIGRFMYIALLTLNIWKLSVLFVDDRRDLWHALAFVAVQVPLWVPQGDDDDDDDDHQHAEEPMSPGVGARFGGSKAASKNGHMSRAWVFVHVSSILAVMWLCKNTILAHLLHGSGLATLMLGGGGGGGSSSSSALPTESTFVGWWGVCSAGACLGLTFGRGLRHDPRTLGYRRTNILGLLVALTFFVVQPRLDFLGGVATFDGESDVFERGMETAHPRWPAWILFGTLTTILLCVSSVATQSSSSSASSSGASVGSGLLWVPRPLLALGLGCSIGLYALGTTLPFQTTLYALFMAAFNAATFFVVYMFVKPAPSSKAATMSGAVESSGGGFFGFFRSKSSASGPSSVLPMAYCALVALLPVTYAAIGLVYSSSNVLAGVGSGGSGSNRGSRNAGDGAEAGIGSSYPPPPPSAGAADIADVRTLYRIALLSVHAALHFVVALGVNIQREMAATAQSKEARFKNLQQYNSGFVAGNGGGGVGSALGGVRRDGAGVGQHHNPDGGGALCFLGNVSSILCFLLGCAVSQSMLGSSVATSTTLFAPLLLMLNRDNTSGWGRKIDPNSATGKWGPVVTGACVVLLWSALVDLLLRPLLSPLGLVSAIPLVLSGGARAVGWWFRCKNLLLLLMCAPSLHSFLGFLWSSRNRVSTFRLLMLAPLNLLPLLCTDLSSLQLLAVVATVGVCTQAYAMRASNRHGMRLI